MRLKCSYKHYCLLISSVLVVLSHVGCLRIKVCKSLPQKCYINIACVINFLKKFDERRPRTLSISFSLIFHCILVMLVTKSCPSKSKKDFSCI